MATIRAATPEPWARPYLANVTTTDVTTSTMVLPYAMNEERTTLYGARGKDVVRSVNDGATWTVVKTFPLDVMGVWVLPDGEALVSLKRGWALGELWRSAGFKTNDVTATWTLCPLTFSRNGNYVRGEWGLSFAPKRHPREGLVVATEYGVQSRETDPDETVGKAWVSLDYGQTWRTIFDLATEVGKINQHMHGILYDAHDDRVFVSFGDGNGSGAAWTGVLTTANWSDAAPDWHWASGPTGTADQQATTLIDCPSGIIAGGDGVPAGLYRLPRRGQSKFGTMHQVMNYGTGTGAGYITGMMYRHRFGFPIVIGRIYTKTDPYPTAVDVSFDGTKFAEVWRADGGAPASTHPVGPTKTGRVFIAVKDYVSGAERVRHVIGELIIP